MVKLKLTLGLAFVTVFLLTQVSCKNEVLPDVNADELCFERDVLPIFVSNCSMGGCHDAGTGADGYVLTNYGTITGSDKGKGIVAGNPRESEIWEVIESGEMPPKRELTSMEKSIIKTWIADGAKNGMNCSSNCDTAVFTYSGAISPIIVKQCIGCHQYPNANGGLDLGGYSNIKQTALSGALMNSLKGTNGYQKMPPTGNGLSACEIEQFQKWINNGAPED